MQLPNQLTIHSVWRNCKKQCDGTMTDATRFPDDVLNLLFKTAKGQCRIELG